MLAISAREFREKQKMYLDLVDQNKQVIVQRGKNKAYTLAPITSTDCFFADAEVKARISIKYLIFLPRTLLTGIKIIRQQPYLTSFNFP